MLNEKSKKILIPQIFSIAPQSLLDNVLLWIFKIGTGKIHVYFLKFSAEKLDKIVCLRIIKIDSFECFPAIETWNIALTLVNPLSRNKKLVLKIFRLFKLAIFLSFGSVWRKILDVNVVHPMFDFISHRLPYVKIDLDFDNLAKGKDPISILPASRAFRKFLTSVKRSAINLTNSFESISVWPNPNTRRLSFVISSKI